MSDEIVLQTFSLGKCYGKRWAVRELDLTVHRGEIFGFLGPNGAGKSTTIRMILSLIRPTTGRVELFGKSLRENRREVLSRVGGLVERPDFYLYLSARRNLEIIAALRGGVSRQHLSETLAIVGLSDRAEDPVKTFSHGMKQRLGIAQALLGTPDFIVLDEPTSGLDPQGIKEVRELVVHLSSDRRMTIFLSSHLLHEIEQTATNMAIISDGRMAVQGGVRDLLSEREVTVRFDARPSERAREVLAGLSFASRIIGDGDTTEVVLPSDRIAEVNRLLVQAGMEVRSVIPRRSLEEYFLAITEGASEVSSTAKRKRHH
jgi:ABC-2 type transport system ATP-binding protein